MLHNLAGLLNLTSGSVDVKAWEARMAQLHVTATGTDLEGHPRVRPSKTKRKKVLPREA